MREFDPGPAEEAPPIVELVTFGVGEVIFEKWGHTAICLRYHDPARTPICFNYGVTDFDAGSQLVWTFVRGKQRFWVEPTSLTSLLAFYSGEDRDIFVQALPLPPAQARAIEARLWRDVTDEQHRFYVYEHFLDNCTTRIRDMIDEATGGALRKDAGGTFPLTFRQLGGRGLAELPELFVLADFVLGRQLDRPVTLYEAMFHPVVLRDEIEARFGAAPTVLSARQGPPFPTSGPTGRWQMFLVAFAVALPIALARWRRSRRLEQAGTILATVYLGLWGVLIWGLVIVSPIQAVRWNEVALVLTPLDLVLPFLPIPRRRRYARLRVVGLVLVSALAAIGLLHQPLWIPLFTALLPLAAIAFEDRA